MYLCDAEAAEELAGLIKAGLLDRVQLTVWQLHQCGIRKRRLNRALASSGVLKAMYHCIADMEISRRRHDHELRRLLVWRHRVTRFGLRWAFTPFVRAKQAKLRRLNGDMAFLSDWIDQIAVHIRKNDAAPIPGAVSMLRDAARASRRDCRERCEELRHRAISRYGQEEVDYVDEAYRLCYTPPVRTKVEPTRVRASFARSRISCGGRELKGKAHDHRPLERPLSRS